LWEFLVTNPEVSCSIPCITSFFGEVVDLERGSLSLVRITEELLKRKVAALI
jgi:hypothetical protein